MTQLSQDAIQRNRLALLDALGSSRYTQIKGRYYQELDDGSIGYCACGVARCLADAGFLYYYGMTSRTFSDLIVLNDDDGLTFPEIARWLAARWDLLDVWKEPSPKAATE